MTSRNAILFVILISEHFVVSPRNLSTAAGLVTGLLTHRADKDGGAALLRNLSAFLFWDLAALFFGNILALLFRNLF